MLRVRLADGDDRYNGTALPRQLQQAPGGRTSLETRIDAGDGADSIESGATNDTVTPGPGDDVTFAGAGGDLFRAGREADGTDLIDGGETRDFAEYRDRSDPLSLTLDGVANDGASGEGDQLLGIESISGGKADDLLVGDEKANDILGGGGADAAAGLGGDDVLYGDDLFTLLNLDDARALAGDDVLDGGEGNDELLGSFGEDQLLGGPGDDGIDATLALILSVFDAESEPDRAADQVDCGPGSDEVVPEKQDAVVSCETEVAFIDSGDDR